MKAHTRSAFTLLEMVIVVGIMLALATLIFATLGPAREKSRQSVCASNMHQWGKAYAMYIADWDGQDPVKGVPLTRYQLGLPPKTLQFFEAYRLLPVARCPSMHYSDIREERLIPIISYEIAADPIGPGAPEYPKTVAHYGPELPLLVCFMHNANTDFGNQPTWATKRLQTLRINQQLDFRQIPVHGSLW